MLENTEAFWRAAWSRHFDSYQRVRSTHADYVSFHLRSTRCRVLELGAGSFRDTVQLCDAGIDAVGTDFVEDAVQFARQAFPEHREKMQQMDASKLSFQDKYFDVSFHNGLFTCFKDDEMIDAILREQVRVTRDFIVCTVHNADHYAQRLTFQRKALDDDLYDIRFFDVDEISSLLRPHCKSVRVFACEQRIIDAMLRRSYLRPFARSAFSCLATVLQNSGKRLMAIGYL